MTDHAYGHVLTSTATGVTRAIVEANHLILETLTVTQRVVLPWDAFGDLAAYIEAHALPLMDPVAGHQAPRGGC
jgi:hypothetical protein